MVTADGAPLVWLSKIAGKPTDGRAAGSDMTTPLFQRAADKGWRIYFLGGAKGMAQAAALKARDQFPGLKIAGAEGPMIDMDNHNETMKVVERIRRKNCDLLLVGLGCPKQEFFLAKYLQPSGAKVGIGVGGSFDFISGQKNRAPRWMRGAGLEWTYRWSLEPRRLASRYLGNIMMLPKLIVSAIKSR